MHRMDLTRENLGVRNKKNGGVRGRRSGANSGDLGIMRKRGAGQSQENASEKNSL